MVRCSAVGDMLGKLVSNPPAGCVNPGKRIEAWRVRERTHVLGMYVDAASTRVAQRSRVVVKGCYLRA